MTVRTGKVAMLKLGQSCQYGGAAPMGTVPVEISNDAFFTQNEAPVFAAESCGAIVESGGPTSAETSTPSAESVAGEPASAPGGAASQVLGNSADATQPGIAEESAALVGGVGSCPTAASKSGAAAPTLCPRSTSSLERHALRTPAAPSDA